jgi:hypothetical protein
MHRAPTIFNLRFTVNDLQKDCVIANDVKQSHKSEFRLLCLPVHYTQTGRFNPRNDIDGFN